MLFCCHGVGSPTRFLSIQSQPDSWKTLFCTSLLERVLESLRLVSSVTLSTEEPSRSLYSIRGKFKCYLQVWHYLSVTLPLCASPPRLLSVKTWWVPWKVWSIFASHLSHRGPQRMTCSYCIRNHLNRPQLPAPCTQPCELNVFAQTVISHRNREQSALPTVPSNIPMLSLSISRSS